MAPQLARRFAPMALHIGEHVELRMTEMGMAVSTLAERIGTHRNTLSGWISDGQFSVAMLRKISLNLERNFLRILAEEIDNEMPGLRVVREPQATAYAPKYTPVRIEMDMLDPEQQDMVLDFADKLRRVQERRLKS